MSAPVSLQVTLGFLLFSFVFIPLERYFPRRQLTVFRPGYMTDIIYYMLGCLVGRFSDTISRLIAVWFSTAASGDSSSTSLARQPGWIQFLELLIIADFLAYIFHRCLHRYSFLWTFHKIHHSEEAMDWLANVRLHPVDKILGDCFQFIPIFCLGFAEGPLLAYTIFLGFQGFVNHSNIKLNYGPLRWVIASPQFHHWHHSDDGNCYNKNFSPHLVIFDLLFGTIFLPDDRSTPEKYGLPFPIPEAFLEQIFYPIRGVAEGIKRLVRRFDLANRS